MPRSLYMKYYILAAAVVIFDQITKVIVRMNMSVGETINVLGDFFSFMYIRNSGAAFSMMSGNRVFLIFVPIIAILLALVYLYKHKEEHFTLPLALTLVIAGGIGNLIDRVLFGEVTDMLSFSIFPPVFNVADIAVTFGCVILVIYVFQWENKSEKKSK